MSTTMIPGKRQLERRIFPARELRVDDSESDESNEPKIVGYAAVFNQRTELWTDHFEEILPGAFEESLKADDIRALFNHDVNYVLGRNKAKTLRLSEDEHGLAIEIDPPDTQLGRDTVVLIRRGDISQMSIGFWVLDEEYKKEDGKRIRIISKAKLFDVSPVTAAAYPTTEVSVRMNLSLQRSIEASFAAWEQEQQPRTSIATARRRLDLRMRQAGISREMTD